MNKKEKEMTNKKFKEYQDAISEMTDALLDALTPIIKKATEEIKKANKNVIDNLELIQDEENEKDT